MRSPRAILLILFLLFTPISLWAQDEQLILERTQHLYRTVDAFWFEGTISVSIEAGGNEREYMFPIRTAERRPQEQLLVMVGGGATPMTVVSNPNDTWLYDPSNGKYMHRLGSLRLGPERSDIPDLLAGYKSILKDAKRIDRKEDAMVMVNNERRDCYVLSVLKQSAMDYLQEDSTVVEVWVDQQSGIVWQETRIDYRKNEPRFRGPAAITQTTRFTKAELATDVPESLFDFFPPRGAVRVDGMERFPQVSNSLRGLPFPALTLHTLDDSLEVVENNRGKILLINFWTTTCESCSAMLASADSLQAAYGDTVLKVLAINQEEFKADVDSYLESAGYSSMQIFLDRTGNAAEWLDVKEHPTSFLVAGGVIREHFIGAQPVDTLIRALEGLGLEANPSGE